MEKIETAEIKMQTVVETEKPARPKDKKKKFTVWAVIVLILLSFALTVMVQGVLYSLVNYKPARGLADSEWVGLEWYTRLSQDPQLQLAGVNSLLLKGVQILAGLVLALPLLLWIRISRKPGTALTKACLCLIPMCLPFLTAAQAVLALFPRELFLNPDMYPVTFAAATVIQTGGFFAFCGGLFHYLSRRGIGRGAWQGLLAALLVSLLTMLTPEWAASHALRNSMNARSSTTFDLMIYTRGLQKYQISYASAISAVKVLLQILLAILPAALLIRIGKEDKTRIDLPDARGGGLIFTTAQLIWIALLAGLLVVSMGIATVTARPDASAEAIGSVLQNQQVLLSALNSLVLALATGLFGGFAVYALIAHFRTARRGLGLTVILLTSVPGFLMSEYLLVRSMGLINTLYAPVLADLLDPRMIGIAFILILILRMAPERSARGLLLGLMLLGAAFAWGNFSNMIVYVSSSSLSSLPTLLYRVMMMGAAVGDAGSMTEAQLMMEAARTPVLSLLTALPAVLFASGGAACFIRAFRSAK